MRLKAKRLGSPKLLKKSFDLLLCFFTLNLMVYAEVSQARMSSLCETASFTKQEPSVITQDLKSFVEAAVSESAVAQSVKSQNRIFHYNFDLKEIYRNSKEIYNSKVIGNYLIDYIKTNYFGNLRYTYKKLKKRLATKHWDLLRPSQRQSLQKNKILITKVVRRNCSMDEEKLFSCQLPVVEVEVQSLPQISCFDQNLKDGLSSHFYIFQDQRTGFKIFDVELNGKRLISDAIMHLKNLKQRKFNKHAAAAHLSLLSKDRKSFKPLKTVPHSRFYLSKKHTKKSRPRLPASL